MLYYCKFINIYLNINYLNTAVFKFVNNESKRIYKIKHLKFGVFHALMTRQFIQKSNALQRPKNAFSEISDFYSTPPVFHFLTSVFLVHFFPIYSHLINICFLALE